MAEPQLIIDRFYKTIINSVYDMIFLHDLDGNILDVNQKAFKSMSYSKEELCSEDFDLEKFDFNETSPGIAKQIEQANNQSNVSRTYEGTIICKSGKKKQVEFLELNNEIDDFNMCRYSAHCIKKGTLGA